MPIAYAALTTEAFIPPGSYGNTTVLAFIDIGLNGFTQDRFGSIQRTQVKHAVFEVFLNKSYVSPTPHPCVSILTNLLCEWVCATYIGIDFGMAYGKRALTVQKHAAVARALVLLFFSTLIRVSGIGFFITSVNTQKDLNSCTRQKVQTRGSF